MFATQSTNPNRSTTKLVVKQTPGQLAAAGRKRANRKQRADELAAQAAAAGQTVVQFQSELYKKADALRASYGPRIQGSGPPPTPTGKNVAYAGESKTAKMKKGRRH